MGQVTPEATGDMAFPGPTCRPSFFKQLLPYAIARVRHSRKVESSSTGQPAAKLSRFERLKMFCRSNSDGAKIIKQKVE